MKEIQLTQRQVTLVDDTDYEWLNKNKWFAHRMGSHTTFYAVRNVQLTKYKRKINSMHRLILRLQSGDKQQCDHIDGNGLNNQQSNLRVCTAAQNQQSRRNLRVGMSRYKGVDSICGYGKWRSRIYVNKKSILLGWFDSEVLAAQSYDKAAITYFGEFALSNKMLGLLERE